MRSIQLALEGAGNVLVVGLLFGAGLPVIYALAMRALVVGADEAPDGSVRYSPLGRVLAGLLVAIIVGGVVLGLVLIVASGFGKAVSFEHVFPTIVDKK
ncbi:hypothetical protein KMZ32_08040 [Phycicoccus sp. MAQZ13P-2]|uniref:hypothetical protein n=1 Tax=Phycicoccus mangrovi TaxID=2840470 RepID=UPI001C00731A|nr:hypothetical protein [Phycicoccus mangrovi]MBT9255037.1 hypothetical protein [Phycicoccus mangrovi]MBT9274021.1 hypothetical protein [Phycicoccus mangrovi]